MTTAIAIPNKISNTAPKPTKSQLIEALMVRAKEAHKAAEAEKEIRCAALEAEGIKIVLAEYKKAKADPSKIKIFNRWSQNDSAEITIEVMTPRLKAIQKEMNKNRATHFAEDATKTKTREGLQAPNPLLGNQDTVKALDQLLATIMGQPKLEAIEV